MSEKRGSGAPAEVAGPGLGLEGGACAYDPPSTGGRSRVRSLWDEFWPYILVPPFLTILFAVTNAWHGWRSLLWSFVFDTIAVWCIGGCLHILLSGPVPWLSLRLRGRAWRPVLQAVATVVGVALGTELAVLLLGLFPVMPPRAILRRQILPVGLIVGSAVVVIILTYGRLRAHAREVELREERARRETLRAQLQALQARTNPHFLYNSLNTVASLIEEDPQRAELVLERLAGLFRYALEGSSTSHVTLAEEVRAVTSYLEIEGLRFGDRLKSRVEVEPGLETCLVPPLVLQPLVENAVLHGVASRREGGAVEVRAARENGRLVLCVEDDGPGPGGSTHQGTRTGLAELQRRLELALGAGVRLEAGARQPEGYRVRLVLPLSPPPGSIAAPAPGEP